MSQTYINTDECWLYAGYKNPDGYGVIFCTVNGKTINHRAHRVTYENFVAPIPDNMVLDHLCRVRHCINPAHLEAVTDKENIMRGIGASAKNSVKTHCPNGHPYNNRNTYTHTSAKGNKERYCRRCRDAYIYRWRARKRVAELR